VLISAVLRILDKQDVAPREAVAPVTEPFAALLPLGGSVQDRSTAIPELRQDNLEAMSRIDPPTPRERASAFAVEQRSYGTFLRALEESKKPRASHALDLFQ
jgi:hypothetical protein